MLWVIGIPVLATSLSSHPRKRWSAESGIDMLSRIRSFGAKCPSCWARAGVPVNVIIDWVGSNEMERSLLDSLQAAGVQLHRYRPLQWYSLQRMNNRTHRKVLVVDGRIGFTGGVGIADQWSGDGGDPEQWRDSVVAAFAFAFCCLGRTSIR